MMKRSTSTVGVIGRIAATLAAGVILTVAPAAAQDEAYYPASMCIGTDENGEPWPAIRFAHGIAENFSDNHTRHLYCPVPYVREANPARIIVRMSGFDNTSDGGLKLRLCEKPLDGFVEEPASCHDDASTGNGSMGFYTLETDFFPTADTRWVYLHIEIPDSDAQTGRSYVSGYRVCRGSC